MEAQHGNRTATRYAFVIALLLSTAAAGNVGAQCTNTPLPGAGVGAVNPANGFPSYYDDNAALAVQPCLDPNPLGPCGAAVVVPNPAAPIVFPGNFPQEFPYFSATATMTLPTGGKAVLAHAVIGSFVGGVAPTAGAQFVFSRLRVRITNLQPFGSYTVTHPYGVDTLVANNLGTINVTFDSGVAGFFGPETVGSRVGPTFLQWDASLPPPPAGFIGDGISEHTVTGSPCGTNFFRLEGPLLPAAGVTQPLFVVVGKTLDICGNRVVDPGEQC